MRISELAYAWSTDVIAMSEVDGKHRQSGWILPTCPSPKTEQRQPLQIEMRSQVTAFCAHSFGMSWPRLSRMFPQFPDLEEQTIIIFDWDDTWLPQWQLMRQFKYVQSASLESWGNGWQSWHVVKMVRLCPSSWIRANKKVTAPVIKVHQGLQCAYGFECCSETLSM